MGCYDGWWIRLNEGTTARWLAAAFVVYGLLAIAFLAIIVPPFQSPDEVSHFMRAAQVAEGTLIGSRTSTTMKRRWSSTDPAILLAFIPFDPLRFHPDSAKRDPRAAETAGCPPPSPPPHHPPHPTPPPPPPPTPPHPPL